MTKGVTMRANEIVRELIEASSIWTQNGLAKRLGLSSQAMSNRMNAGDMKVGFFAEAVEELGCQVVVLPPNVDIPRGAIVVDGEK